MAPHVFISHSVSDKDKAAAICTALESRRIKCWIAPRDIIPGADWGQAIIDAISKSSLMVLVLSGHANASAQVKREVERAVSKGVPVAPVRVEGVQPEGALEYFLGTQHWIDASTPPFEKHLEQVAQSISASVNRSLTNVEQQQVNDTEAARKSARSAPSQVYSIGEVEELSKTGSVLLFTFSSEEGAGENNVRKELVREVFPVFEKVAQKRDISICHARAKGVLLSTPIGKQLKQLGVGGVGVFLFINGRLADHRNLSFIPGSKDFIKAAGQILESLS